VTEPTNTPGSTGAPGQPAPPATPPATPAAAAPGAAPAAATPANPPEKPGAPAAAAAPGEPAKPGEPATPAIPEKYDLKLPDGALLKPEAVERTAAAAKALGLSNENAQKALEFAAGEVKAHQDGMIAEHQARVGEWTKALETDAEVGGTNLEANGQLAWRVIQKFAGDTTLEKDLKASGYNMHPGLFKLLSRIGKAMGEGALVTGNHGGEAPKDAASVMFPSMTQK